MENNNISMIDFIKKYTTVDHKFVDDFFGLYSSENKYNFCIDLEKISKWFKIKRGTIKDTLTRSYKKNVDYKIIKPTKNFKTSKTNIKKNNTGKVGAPKEIILLTPKCFKMVAMQGKSEKSSEVRNYYYELEELVERYKNHINDSMTKKIKQLENNQKPTVNPERGVIYILQASDGVGHYKIGMTKNLAKRLQSYNSDKKDDIIPLYTYETDDIKIVESCVKSYAKKFQYRKIKEIYKVDIKTLKNLIKDCGEFNEKTNLKFKKKPRTKAIETYIYLHKSN